MCRPITVTRQTSDYQFDGTGYASHSQIRYAADKYDVFLDFKAIWKDALLFFMANDATVCYHSVDKIDAGGKVYPSCM